MGFLNSFYFGNTLMQYIVYCLVISFSIVLARISYLFFKRIVSKWVQKTKWQFDDIFVDMFEEPFSFLIVILGFAYGKTLLSLPPSFAGIYGNLIKILVILDVAWFVLRLVDGIFVHYLAHFVKNVKNDIDDAVIRLIRRVLKIFGGALTLIILLDNLGYDVTTLIAGLGIGGLAVALAAQDLLSNLFGGISVVTDKPFKVGDRIKFDKYEGFVEDVGLRSTKIRTLEGSQLIVPNNVLTKSVVENVSRKDISTVSKKKKTSKKK
jgi:MscS family membrane protein